ncbi:MAG: competence/damage-inducible protein A [Marinifilaceae bacterium]|jgi:nicotinamide-nucleotide amidase|nr:competence/damage-inducible protein A [Marinifilaceae bacterium]
MKCNIITIGNELLIGQTIDTNSAWIGKQLNSIGIDIQKIISISDNAKEINANLELAMKDADIVLVTGGLGPTNDDITKKTLADFFETELELNDYLLNKIKTRLSGLKIPINKLNHDQALFPKKAKIIDNDYGTASAMLFEHGDKIIISMPGVPGEMKGIMTDQVIPLFKNKYHLDEIRHHNVMVFGVPESMIAQKLENFENELEEGVSLAYLPSLGTVKLRLSFRNIPHDRVEELIEAYNKVLKSIFGENIFAYNEETLVNDVLNKLRNQGQTISTAESCTGGKIANMISSIPGCSEVFNGSVVSYSNEVKINVLSINKENIDKYGAVSQQVVEEMAMGARKLLDTDYAVASSGIAGPDGGTEEKPVGTVWIAVANKDMVISKQLNLFKNRNVNINLASKHALNLLRLNFLNEK